MFHDATRNAWVYLVSDSFYYGGRGVNAAFLSALIASKAWQGRLDVICFVLGYNMLPKVVHESALSRMARRFAIVCKIRISLPYTVGRLCAAW